jgi:hypothetical protein
LPFLSLFLVQILAGEGRREGRRTEKGNRKPENGEGKPETGEGRREKGKRRPETGVIDYWICTLYLNNLED